MKKLAVILGIVLAATAFTFPAYAMGGGMGGGGMMGNSGSDLMDWFRQGQNRSGYAGPAAEERKQIGAVDRQHQEDTVYLKYQIETKEKELDALLNSTNPDMEKVRALHRDIRDLRAESVQEQRRYEVEAGRMNPRYGSGSYGRPGDRSNGGMGYGGPMGGYGRGR
ncbi:MAG: hypothetical protein V1758_03240 [Pseudomonadota bacterium]